jgi:hypothetical protein
MKRYVFIIIALLFAAMSMSAQNVSDYKADAERGDKVAQYNLGLCYYRGEGVAQSYSIASKWFLKSAQQNYVLSQRLLSYCYHKLNDNTKATYWLRKAAVQGDSWAQYILGQFYEEGMGVTKNKAQEIYWFKKAAEQGLSEAQTSLGMHYEKGDGVAQNNSQALYWYRKAAEQDNYMALYLMGVMYDVGKTVGRDGNTALYLFKKSLQILKGNSDLSSYELNIKGFCEFKIDKLTKEGCVSSKSQLKFNEKNFLTVNDKTDVTSSYSYSGGTYSYTVNTNASDYEVNALPSWCSASKSGNTFTITCQRNSDNSSRADWFRVKAGSLEVKVHVSQGSDPNAIAGEIENVWIDFDAVQQNFFLYTKGMNIHIKFKTNNLYNTNCAACAFFYYQNGTPLDDCDFQYRTSDGHVYAETSFKPGYTNCTYNDLVIFMPYPQLHMAIGTYNLKFDLELQEKSSGSWKTFARKNDNNFLFYNTGF